MRYDMAQFWENESFVYIQYTLQVHTRIFLFTIFLLLLLHDVIYTYVTFCFTLVPLFSYWHCSLWVLRMAQFLHFPLWALRYYIYIFSIFFSSSIWERKVLSAGFNCGSCGFRSIVQLFWYFLLIHTHIVPSYPVKKKKKRTSCD